ncbi:conserved hypothetical protein [Leishmania braziliensis MHOM/BR/75/M2904]|uniref:Uncharacterized protein n=3 Tax=Leishmania braziliensis TaxID=5660 RepID=A4H470_LEIBR|nr:conserved hypothetical protein [Leishmania braziliensis MHOM/BR/75/M2904]CAJ2466305.1 unnamed protein product [Leishmania braziliensis]CAM36859.1 conserved hypothetical protein [Leishmania braziliensis MHOM/BR/75/M2904]
MEDVLGGEEMAKLTAHPALHAIVKAYSLDEQANGGAAEDGEDASKEGGADAYYQDDDAALLDEDAEEAAEADREAQQRDILLYKRLLAHQLHCGSIAQHIQQHGLLRMSTTPPVDMTMYGILFSCREVPPASGAAEHSESSVSLQVRWQPSKRSRYAGTPLHWAVLARAHDAVRFLVEHGADCTAGLKAVTNDGTAPDAQLMMYDQKVLATLTPARMAAANESHSTLEVLKRAVAAQAVTRADEEAFFVVLEERLRRRKEAYLRRLEEARMRRQHESEEEARRAEVEEAEVEEAEEEEEGNVSGEDGDSEEKEEADG